MCDFEKFITRHGEAAAQAIVENFERFKGIRRETAASLEERWQALMSADDSALAA